MGAYNLMTILSFAIDFAPLLILLSKRMRILIAKIILFLIRDELVVSIRPIVRDEIKRYEHEQNERKNSEEKTASVLRKLLAAFLR